MKKTIIATATLMALASISLPVFSAELLKPVENLTVGSGEYLGVFSDKKDVTVTFNASNGTVAFTGKDAVSGSIHSALYLNNSNATINADILRFDSQEIKDKDPDHPLGSYSYFQGWQAGNSSLTMNVKELYIGKDSTSLDRGFQLKGANNSLTLMADKVVAYVGDGFINAQGAKGTSNVTLGTDAQRIKHFEVHTTYGKNDWGVAAIQTNEGNTVSLYAEDVILDGPNGAVGGVLGSGGWGNLVVDVSNKLTIDGNICGSYGAMIGTVTDETSSNLGVVHANTVFFLDVNAKELSMIGDVNAGSMKEMTPSEFDGKSKGDRTVVINVSSTGTIDGSVNVYEHGNVALAGDLTLTKGITIQDDGHVLIGGRITTDATVDGSKEFNKFEEYGMGKVTVGGNIDVKENGTLTVGGILDASNNVITFDAQTRAVLFAAEATTPVAGLTVTEGAKVMAKEIKAASTDASLGAGSELVVDEAQFRTLYGSGNGEAAKVTTNGLVQTQTVDKNVNVVFNAQGASFTTNTKADTATVTASVSSSFAETFTSQQAAAEYANSNATVAQGANTSLADRVEVAETESNGKYTANIGSDGKIDYSTAHQTLNSKTAQVGETIGFNLLSWRLEMNDMNKRLGELRDSEGDTGVWARVNAGKQKYAGSKNNFQQLQFGADTKVDALAGAYVGGAFSYTNSDISYVGGDGDNNIYGLSAYASWLGDTGSFMDVIAKVARLESDSKVFGTSADFDTYAYSISAEIGHRFDIGTVAFVEPQLEVNYGYVDGKGFDTVSSTGVRVGTDVDAVESLVGRVGFRAGFTCPQKKGNAYIHASVLREFDGDMKVSRGDGAYAQDMGDTWFEYGIGGNWNVSPSTQVYADVQRTSGADLSEPWRVNVGARYVF